MKTAREVQEEPRTWQRRTREEQQAVKNTLRDNPYMTHREVGKVLKMPRPTVTYMANRRDRDSDDERSRTRSWSAIPLLRNSFNFFKSVLSFNIC